MKPRISTIEFTRQDRDEISALPAANGRDRREVGLFQVVKS
ncbi:hypothetical protein [Haloarcula limicola]|nr:hypothetical protein [Halomicroarcula limicola]